MERRAKMVPSLERAAFLTVLLVQFEEMPGMYAGKSDIIKITQYTFPRHTQAGSWEIYEFSNAAFSFATF